MVLSALRDFIVGLVMSFFAILTARDGGVVPGEVALYISLQPASAALTSVVRERCWALQRDRAAALSHLWVLLPMLLLPGGAGFCAVYTRHGGAGAAGRTPQRRRICRCTLVGALVAVLAD